MTAFKKTNWKIFVKPGAVSTPDSVYWKKLGVPVIVKEFGPIDYIDFSPVEPHYFAATCSVHVQLYNPITKYVAKNLSRFRETAYGGAFRSDGQLICAGGEESVVKVFDVESKALLRIFKGHEGAVHRCFFTSDKTHIASFSDDKSVRLWDIPSEKVVTQFSEHTDYVRAGAVSPVSPDSILSGGYDHCVHMYDTRTNASVFKVDHGAPVESVVFLPTGGIFVSAGGTEVRVWDALAGGRLLAKLSHHHKTITCLSLSQHSNRLLSGSLDRHVKIYDISTYQVVHTVDYPSSVLSLGVSVDDTTLVAGTVDGLVSVARRDEEVKMNKAERKEALKPPSYKNIDTKKIDIVVPKTVTARQTTIDISVRKFNYSHALDKVTRPHVLRKKPELTVGLCQELIRRKGLTQALAGRDDKFLVAFIGFLTRCMGNHRFTRVLIDIINHLLNIYEDVDDHNPEVVQMLKNLAIQMREEEQVMEQMLGLQGSLQMLLSGASVNAKKTNVSESSTVAKLEPSKRATKSFVISV